jgi:hypothetical protein
MSSTRGDQAMECYLLTTEHALLSMSEVDMDDVRLGQLLVLSVGLSVLLLGRLLYLVT